MSRSSNSLLVCLHMDLKIKREDRKSLSQLVQRILLHENKIHLKKNETDLQMQLYIVFLLFLASLKYGNWSIIILLIINLFFEP